jgi:putative tricarboxylic transport membrane protein
MSEAWQDEPAATPRGSWPFNCCSRRGGLWVAGLLGLTGIGFSSQALNLTFGNLDLPGPGFFPFALGLLLIALSVAIFIMVFQEPREAPKVEIGHWPVIISLIAMSAATALFERAGAFLSLGGFMLVMLATVGRVRIIPAALTSVISMLVVWYVFKVLLGVQLPAGPLEGIL